MEAIVKKQFKQLAGVFDEGDVVDIVPDGTGYSIKSKNGNTYGEGWFMSMLGPRPLTDVFRKVLTMNYSKS